MKRLLYILFLLPLGLNAQNMYNITSLFDNDLVGTARYVGMGGSMSALGADLSTIGTNPAGMAMFRSNDCSITANFDLKTNKSDYLGSVMENSITNAGIGNASFVVSFEREKSKMKYLNFGLAYRRKNNLTGIFEMSGVADIFSQQYLMEQLYCEYDKPFNHNNVTAKDYNSFSYSWLTLLAANAKLSDATGENFLSDSMLIWVPSDLAYYEETRGGVHTVDLNLSANIEDRIYLGATVGISSVDYNHYSKYSEADGEGDIYVLENDRYIKGGGFDIKLGAIFRPFKYSPFKVGLSLHTPTWYSLSEYSSATIVGPNGHTSSTIDPNCYNDMLVIAESVSTPWRFNASMGYTFGTYLALNAEYEFADYSLAGYTSRGSVFKAQNDEIKMNMKAQHTARIGAEINVEGFAVRAGYNYMTSPFELGAYKDMYNASRAETSTEYMNRFDKHIATLGLGYRGKILYCDVAYMLESQDAEFYPYKDYEEPNPGAVVTHTNHSIVGTVGIRF